MKSAALSLAGTLIDSVHEWTAGTQSGLAARSTILWSAVRPGFGAQLSIGGSVPLCGRQVSAPQLAATAPPSAVASIDPAATVVALLEASVPAAAVASAELELPPKLADPISKVAVSPSEEGRSTPVALCLTWSLPR